ncbi:helix-turn-helix transcriptional regulator [Streptomyces sp. NPDC056169]|uniref:helix-turn-helix transcriptional regulator n=1 Tax=Streptomyces sp. NPDC056169 TaxID=3345734 RepID=UPI0035DFD19D
MSAGVFSYTVVHMALPRPAKDGAALLWPKPGQLAARADACTRLAAWSAVPGGAGGADVGWGSVADTRPFSRSNSLPGWVKTKRSWASDVGGMPSDQPTWVLSRRQTIGARVRAAREHANLSQLQLGDLVGADHKTIHRIEYGASDPSLGLLLQIARAVGLPLAELVR